MIMYHNGQYVEEDSVRISPFDHGFLYGMGLFETIRLYDGHPFLINDHLSRLNQGLMDMCIDLVMDEDEMATVLKQLMDRNNLKHARVRINVSAGEGIVGLPNQHYQNPTILIFISALPESNELLQVKSLKVLTLPRNTPEQCIRSKSHHYGNNIAAKMELGNQTEVEGLFLTKEHIISEAITSNIFWVKGETLYTPAISTGILPGITRAYIIQLANDMGLVVEEGHYPLENLLHADEVFLTNSIQEIVAIDQLVEQATFAGVEGSVTNALFIEYKKQRMRLKTIQTIR